MLTWLRKLRLLTAYPMAVVRHPDAALRYFMFDREFTNLTYDIDNVDELAAFLADLLGRPVEEMVAYVHEPLEDVRLLIPLRRKLRERADRNSEPRFGRRIGWYAVVRALRPQSVVETGVHDGLGSALLLHALNLNGLGTLTGFDIDPQSGWLVPDELRDRYELVIGNIRTTLPSWLAIHNVDLFIHDSLHTYEHETFELRSALDHSGGAAVLVSDNAHATTALADLSQQMDLEYGLFRERPRGHFYPGAGVGIALRRSTAQT
jgi:predicted O-methyltransferase YrrM